MSTICESRLTSKGQVTVPEAIRDRLKLQTGDRLEWRVEGETSVVVRRVGRTLDELQGLLGTPDKHVTIEEMDEAVRERFRQRRGAGG